MSTGILNVGTVDDLLAESFGEPGQRTFRIKATTMSGELGLWLEKHQIVLLGAAIEQLLEETPDDFGRQPLPQRETAAVSGEVAARVANMTLAADRLENGFVIEARDLRDATLAVEGIRFLASRSQLADIADQLTDIVAAGRPQCLLCGAPLSGEPHFCPPSNGHARVREG